MRPNNGNQRVISWNLQKQDKTRLRGYNNKNCNRTRDPGGGVSKNDKIPLAFVVKIVEETCLSDWFKSHCQAQNNQPGEMRAAAVRSAARDAARANGISGL